MNRIKEIREKTGLSQSQFAAYFGIPLRNIQKWETDQTKPRPYIADMMERIIDAEGIPDDYVRDKRFKKKEPQAGKATKNDKK